MWKNEVHMTGDSILQALRCGTGLLVLSVAKSDPAAFHRLAGSPFTVRVFLTATPRAEILLDTEVVPVTAIPATAWPPGFGQVLGEFADEVLRRQSTAVRRHTAVALDAGGTLVATLDPDLWVVTLELHIGSSTIAIGRLAPAAEGSC